LRQRGERVRERREPIGVQGENSQAGERREVRERAQVIMIQSKVREENECEKRRRNGVEFIAAEKEGRQRRVK
jgi:hypothetical protein